MIKKQILVHELRLGMYVVELDRPWLGTPFDFQGFPLTTEDQVEQLKSFCKSVYVDPNALSLLHAVFTCCATSDRSRRASRLGQ
jgi:hypothetical protein